MLNPAISDATNTILNGYLKRISHTHMVVRDVGSPNTTMASCIDIPYAETQVHLGQLLSAESASLFYLRLADFDTVNPCQPFMWDSVLLDTSVGRDCSYGIRVFHLYRDLYPIGVIIGSIMA
ncbi:hypothetical protein A7D00_4070 [Trichophyton violaceum]|uniref:Uncharacterized protein n=1 Tax=Trichophyton violaceum TaxID=34388 RepID=A0A178FIV2_TRIVO|nr:hypothetical protein A7D00_4070 [Trichophyton violaceum]